MNTMEPSTASQHAQKETTMKDLSFDVELTWSAPGRQGAGQIQTDDLVLELSGPKSMGGLGTGTNPEELLVCAVSSCYTATLFAVLRRAQLPVDSLAVAASGTVTGFPTATRFARIVVTPTIIGGDIARQSEYEAAASLAHDRCFIGHTLAPEVVYEVGSVHVQGDLALAPTPGQRLPGSEDAGERPSGSRAA
jgi:peroxiredoxin-like protein